MYTDMLVYQYVSMYTNTRCCVRTKDGYCDTFDIITGVRQGYILSPFLFLIVMDVVVRKSMSNPQYGISWSPGRLTDLDFADDIVMLSDSHDIIQHMTDDSTLMLQKSACAFYITLHYIF